MFTYNQLKTICAKDGVNVIEIHPLETMGYYHLATNTIFIRETMSTRHKLAVLAHEYQHFLRGDDGHQDEATERIVDERAARMLISDREYASAENLVGADPRAIAIELDLPLWLVDAWKPDNINLNIYQTLGRRI